MLVYKCMLGELDIYYVLCGLVILFDTMMIAGDYPFSKATLGAPLIIILGIEYN